MFFKIKLDEKLDEQKDGEEKDSESWNKHTKLWRTTAVVLKMQNDIWYTGRVTYLTSPPPFQYQK